MTCADADAEVGVAGGALKLQPIGVIEVPSWHLGTFWHGAQVLMPLNWQPCQPYDVYQGPDRLSVDNAYDINMRLPVVSDRLRDGPTRNPTQ